jgi:hypothetical protein
MVFEVELILSHKLKIPLLVFLWVSLLCKFVNFGFVAKYVNLIIFSIDMVDVRERCDIKISIFDPGTKTFFYSNHINSC